MIFFSIVLLIVAAMCFFAMRSNSSKLRVMNATDTYTAQMLADLHSRVVASVGGEALAEPCEVAGTIEADAPLVAPLSGTQCVAFVHTVTREFEEDTTVPDTNGVMQTQTTRHSEQVERTERRARFFVRDATGRVQVDPEEADLDFVETGTRFDAQPPKTGDRTRTLGYRHDEQALAVGTQVFILGCATDVAGNVTIARGPREKKLRFMISRSSERDLADSASSEARMFRYITIGSGALGIILLLYGLLGA